MTPEMFDQPQNNSVPMIQCIRSRNMLLLMDILASLLLVWYLSPAARQIGRAIFFAVAFGVWLVFSFCVDKRWLRVFFPGFLMIAAWFMVYTGNYLLGRSTMFYDYLLAMVAFFAPAILFAFYYTTGQTNRLQYFLFLIMALVLITAITTVIGQYRFPNAARLISTGVKEYGVENYSQMNIANYGFSYGLMFFSIVFAGYIKQKHRSIKKLLLYVLLGFFLFVIYKMEFTTSILLAAVGLIIALLMNGRRAVILAAAIAILLLLFIFFEKFFVNVISNLAGSIGSKNIRDRVVALFNLLQGNTTGDISKRSDLYSVSLGSIVNHPLFGVGGYYGYDSANYGVGGHAEILDITARYGIIGLIPMAGFFVFWFIKLLENFKGSCLYGNIKIIIVLFTILACIDVIFNGVEIGVFIFFAIPAMMYMKDLLVHNKKRPESDASKAGV